MLCDFFPKTKHFLNMTISDYSIDMYFLLHSIVTTIKTSSIKFYMPHNEIKFAILRKYLFLTKIFRE